MKIKSKPALEIIFILGSLFVVCIACNKETHTYNIFVSHLSAPASRKAINNLVNLGILREITGKKRDREYKYISYYNSKRPHQGLDQRIPMKYKPHLYGKVQKLPILGGLHHHYFRSAA